MAGRIENLSRFFIIFNRPEPELTSTFQWQTTVSLSLDQEIRDSV